MKKTNLVNTLNLIKKLPNSTDKTALENIHHDLFNAVHHFSLFVSYLEHALENQYFMDSSTISAQSTPNKYLQNIITSYHNCLNEITTRTTEHTIASETNNRQTSKLKAIKNGIIQSVNDQIQATDLTSNMLAAQIKNLRVEINNAIKSSSQFNEMRYTLDTKKNPTQNLSEKTQYLQENILIKPDDFSSIRFNENFENSWLFTKIKSITPKHIFLNSHHFLII